MNNRITVSFRGPLVLFPYPLSFTSSTKDGTSHKLVLLTHIRRAHSTNLTRRPQGREALPYLPLFREHSRLQCLNKVTGCCVSRSLRQLSSSSAEDQVTTSIVIELAEWLGWRGLTEGS